MSAPKGPIDKKLLHRDVFLASVLTFVILFLLKLVIFNTKYLDPISLPLSDFQFTDLYYSQFRKQQADIDTNIVIVNIGENDRAALIQQIQIIESFNPKVIGLDVTFVAQKDAETDSALKAVLHGSIPIILTSNIVYSDQDLHQGTFSTESSNTYFEKKQDEGFGNFLAEEGQTVRYYPPFLSKENEKIPAFSTQIIAKYDSNAYFKLLSRKLKTEIINYQSNNFAKLDVGDIYQNADLNFLKGKIVLMGYMGPNFSQVVFEDNHLTPLNKSYGGHAQSDKYGIEIHANIISMVLRKDYINELPKWVTYVIAFLVCMAHMYLFIYLFVQHHKWFHLGVKLMQLASFAILVFLSLLIFGIFGLKLEPGYIVIGVLLSGDAIYFYEAFVILLHPKFHFKSLFAQNH